jgi:hypothetical protein
MTIKDFVNRVQPSHSWSNSEIARVTYVTYPILHSLSEDDLLYCTELDAAALSHLLTALNAWDIKRLEERVVLEEERKQRLRDNFS